MIGKSQGIDAEIPSLLGEACRWCDGGGLETSGIESVRWSLATRHPCAASGEPASSPWQKFQFGSLSAGLETNTLAPREPRLRRAVPTMGEARQALVMAIPRCRCGPNPTRGELAFPPEPPVAHPRPAAGGEEGKANFSRG